MVIAQTFIDMFANCTTVGAVYRVRHPQEDRGALRTSLTQGKGTGRLQFLLIQAASANGDQVGEDTEVVHVFGP